MRPFGFGDEEATGDISVAGAASSPGEKSSGFVAAVTIDLVVFEDSPFDNVDLMAVKGKEFSQFSTDDTSRFGLEESETFPDEDTAAASSIAPSDDTTGS